MAVEFLYEFETEEVEAWLVKAIRKELTEQGHKLTGKLLDSIRTVSKAVAEGEIEIEIRMLSRYRFTEYGVKANRIPFGNRKGRGEGTSKYIQGLIEFALLRRMTTDREEALSIAFAIARKHKSEGMPTRGSYKYSNNGRRKFFQKTTLTGRELRNKIQSVFTSGLQNSLNQAIKELQRIYPI